VPHGSFRRCPLETLLKRAAATKRKRNKCKHRGCNTKTTARVGYCPLHKDTPAAQMAAQRLGR
jgi:hypothetical protein